MGEQAALDQTAIFNSALTRTSGRGVGSTIDQLDDLSLSEVSGFKELAAPWFSDQTGQIFGCNQVRSSCRTQLATHARGLETRRAAPRRCRARCCSVDSSGASGT